MNKTCEMPAVMGIDFDTNEYVLYFGQSPENHEFAIPLGHHETEQLAEMEAHIVFANVRRYINEVIRSAGIPITISGPDADADRRPPADSDAERGT